MRDRLWKAGQLIEGVGAIIALGAIGAVWACGVAAYRAIDRVVHPGGRP